MKSYKVERYLSFVFIGIIIMIISSAYADSNRPDLPQHKIPASQSGNLVVGNCDGQTTVEVPGKKPGDKLTHAEAKKVSHQLMNSWKKKNPKAGAKWLMVAENKTQEQGPSFQTPPKEDVVTAASQPQTKEVRHQQGIYSDFTPEDKKIWEIEQNKLIAKGKEIFHNADHLKSRTAISCDMCHPNAANTHPETYPKY
jgi:thiosulfate dehydrogenase